jgi:hypothetical protein
MPFCKKCGTQFEAETAFCGNCGNAVGVTATPGMKAPSIPPREPVSDAHEKKTPSLLEQFTSSWKIRVVVIVLTLVGVGIHYSYTQHRRQALIETVRNSHPPEFSKITYGQALESNFKNYTWTTFKNPDKSITVGFVGYQTFQDALGNLDHPDFSSCLKRTFCQPIVKRISDSCIPPGATGEPSQQQQSCFNNGVVSNANTLIPVHLLFAANDQDGSVSLIKTDVVPDQIQ